MNVLIRLYPKAWRERYADELSALLEDRPAGPSDALDLLLGAFDAHLHRRQRGVRPVTRREIPRLSRIGAVAAIAGGALWTLIILGVVTRPTQPSEMFMLLLAVSSLALLVAIAALSAIQSRSHLALVWTSFLLPGIGALLLLVGAVAQVALGDRPFMGDLTPWLPWMIGLLSTLVGSVVFGVVSVTTGAVARWAAALLSAGAVAQLVTAVGNNVLVDGSPILVGGFAFGLSWILVGVLAWRPAPIPDAAQAA